MEEQRLKPREVYFVYGKDGNSVITWFSFKAFANREAKFHKGSVVKFVEVSQ